MQRRSSLVTASPSLFVLTLACSGSPVTPSEGGDVDSGDADSADGPDAGDVDDAAGETGEAGDTGDTDDDTGDTDDAGDIADDGADRGGEDSGTGDASDDGGTEDSGTGNTSDDGGTGDSGNTDDSDGDSDDSGDDSEGCGKAPPPQTDERQTIDVDGTSREFIVNYPEPYDPDHRYPVLYIHHGRGGNAEQNITRNGGWYGVGPLSEGSVIFVSPHGDGDGSTTGWPNSGGRDVDFLRALVAHVNETYCVDQSRIFATGMSYGGNFSNRLGCEMGDVFRAIAPFAGWGPTGGPSGGGGGNANCVGQVASIVTHGTADDVVVFNAGETSRDHWIEANHCTTTTVPTDPSPCVVYEGCDTGYPVAWCEHSEGHILPDFSGPVIWNFISQF